jgi:HopJ type III effector protein
MNLNDYLNKLKTTPENISFKDTISTIDEHYDFTPSAFSNGDTQNNANENNGSCKIFFFAKEHQLSEELTLHCFGDYYRKDVLQNPNANDHKNIRNFMTSGWPALSFDSIALKMK